MASFTLTASQVFPEGTVVSAYLASGWRGAGSPSAGDAPVGSAVSSGTVASGAVTIAGLADAVRYWAMAQVGGVWRQVSFVTPPAPVGSAVRTSVAALTGVGVEYLVDTDGSLIAIYINGVEA